MAKTVNRFGNVIETSDGAGILSDPMRLVQPFLIPTAEEGLGNDPGRPFEQDTPTAQGGAGKDSGRPFERNTPTAEGGYGRDSGRPFDEDPLWGWRQGPSLTEEIVSQINASKGLARQNRYKVFIPAYLLATQSANIYTMNNSVLEYADIEATDWFSDYFGGNGKDMYMELQVYCEKSQLPSYQFAVTTNRHYGPSFKVPHMPEYQDVTMSFICGAEMNERTFFETWMYLVMDPVTNNFNYIHEYSLDIDIIQYTETARAAQNPEDGVNYWTTLVDAYPVAINTQELGYDLNNTFQTLQVTFTYKYAIPFTGKAATLIGRHGELQLFDQTIEPTPPPTPQPDQPEQSQP